MKTISKQDFIRILQEKAMFTNLQTIQFSKKNDSMTNLSRCIKINKVKRDKTIIEEQL